MGGRNFGTGRLFAAVFLAAAVAVSTTPTFAAPTADQLGKAKEVAAKLKKAGNLYKSKKSKESGEAVREAQAALGELLSAGDPKDVVPLAKPLIQNLTKARELLVLEGQKFDPLPELPEIKLTKPGEKPAAGAPLAPGQISFAKQVAPLLIGKCGGCHVQQAKGGFSMATFAELQKGSKEGGTVLSPGSGADSRIVEVIRTGDMPRGGGKISPDELALLTKWIDQGAKFDGGDMSAPLGNLAAAGAPAAKPEMPAVKVEQATGKEDLLFARDIGPVMLTNCTGCHGTNNPRGKLSLASFAGLLKGGDSGAIVTPGNPTDSLLIKKLRGQAGARMPLNKPALEEGVIAKFEKWIAEGAKFDGPDQNMPLQDVVQLLFAARSTHEELSVERAKIAARTWKLTLPDAQSNQHESNDFFVIGNVSQEIVVDVAKTAEDLLPKIAKILAAPADQPLIKGRLTMFVFDKRYDYGEIGTMVEGREIPTTSKGHWRYTGIDAYACIVPPRAGDAQPLDSLVAQQVGGVAIASMGKVPRWFAEGAGRVIASRINPKDPRCRAWDNELPEIVASGGKPDAFLTGGLPPEEGDVAAYGFVKQLMANGPKFNSMLANLRGGKPFDEAFAKAYGGKPEQAAMNWTPSSGPKRRGK